MFATSCGSHRWCMTAYCWWAHGWSFWVITLGAQCWLGYSETCTGAVMMWPIAHHRPQFLGPSGAGRSTAPCGWPQLCTKQVKASIPVPEEVPKWLASSLTDAGLGWTFTGHIPHMPSRCPHGATLLPCATVRCYCSMATSHDISTTPKVASVVNVSPHAWSSHSGEGMARASLDQDEALEVHC